MKTRIGKLIHKILTFLVGEPQIIHPEQLRGPDGRFKKR